MTSWWDTEHWHAYERAYGDAPGTRAALLASATWQTQVIDLTPDEATLWTGIRKSYKAVIHRAERQYRISWLSGAGAGGLIHDCQAVHRLDAGRITRPMATWDLMGDWVEEDHGLIADAWVGDAMRAFAYFIVSDRWAYHASAASLELNVHHALIWTAMKALKARGVTQLEMGWQGQATDAKGKNIEHFRRGFGGETVAVNRQGAER